MFDEVAVDVQGAEELAREIFAGISAGALEPLLEGLRSKSRWVQQALSQDKLPRLDGPQARGLLRRVFGVRRRADALLRSVGVETFRGALGELLYGPEPLEARFTAFCAVVNGSQAWGEAIDVAGEVLHFVFPERYWLWTRWMWNPATQTGALRLVVADWRALLASTPGEVYRRVGEGVAYAEAARESLGVLARVQGERPFLTDVYLACVYTVYLFTVLRMRMSKEFTRILPQPWELVQRLLGVYPGEDKDAEARA